MRFKTSLASGNQGSIYQETLISPIGNSEIDLICKQGKDSVLSEIKIYHLITSNPQSSNKAILQPLLSEIGTYRHRLHSPLMWGGSLAIQQAYLFKALHQPGYTHTIACVWLYQQLLSLLEALCYLHEGRFRVGEDKQQIGIIHGDIKLANILIDAQGCLVLADFACAYLANEPARQFGSLLYTAPELFLNENFTRIAIPSIDKSEIWSLGMSLRYLLVDTFFHLSKKKQNSKTYEMKHYFFTKKVKLNKSKKNSFIETKNLFLEEGIDGHLYRKDWGENYPLTKTAELAKKALSRLEKNAYTACITNNSTSISLSQLNILNDLSTAMLACINKRPNTRWFVNKMKGPLQSFFEPHYKTAEYRLFITDLLANSPLNQPNNHKSYHSFP